MSSRRRQVARRPNLGYCRVDASDERSVHLLIQRWESPWWSMRWAGCTWWVRCRCCVRGRRWSRRCSISGAIYSCPGTALGEVLFGGGQAGVPDLDVRHAPLFHHHGLRPSVGHRECPVGSSREEPVALILAPASQCSVGCAVDQRAYSSPWVPGGVDGWMLRGRAGQVFTPGREVGNRGDGTTDSRIPLGASRRQTVEWKGRTTHVR